MLLVVLVAIVPLIITPGTLFYFDVIPKLIALLLGTAIALPWVLFHPLPLGPVARRFYLLLGAQALSFFASTILSRHIEISVLGSNWRSSGLITHLVLLLFTVVTFAYLAGSAARIRKLLVGIAVAGNLGASYGILQYFGWDPWQPSKAYHAGEGIWTIVRSPGTLGHADYFAAYLVFVVFAGAALGVNDRGPARVLGICATTLGVIAIVLSGTRGALVGLLAGGVFVSFRIRPRMSRRGLAVGGGVVLAAALFYLSPAGLALRSRVHWVTEDTRGGGRLLLWRDSIKLAARHWMLGSGPETFSVEFPRFQSADLARAYPDFYYESPHDLFLDAFTQQGVVGLGILAALIVLGIWCGIESGRRGAPLAAGLVAGVVAHLFTVFIVPTLMYFYLLLAMLVALHAEPQVATRRRWVPALVSLPVSAALVFFALRMLAADRSLELVRRNIENGSTADAIAHYRNARRLGLAADIWYARSLAPPAAQEAIDAALRGTAGEEAQNAWYTAAWLYAREGDVPHTEQSLRETLRCAPNWFKPHWMLAQILRREGRAQEALAEADLAAYLNGGKNPEVTRTASSLRQTVGSR